MLSKIIIFDSSRNNQIVEDIKIEANKGLKCLVLTERKDFWANGNTREITKYDGDLEISSEFYEDGRIDGMTVTEGTQVTQTVEYKYDENKNLTSIELSEKIDGDWVTQTVGPDHPGYPEFMAAQYTNSPKAGTFSENGVDFPIYGTIAEDGSVTGVRKDSNGKVLEVGTWEFDSETGNSFVGGFCTSCKCGGNSCQFVCGERSTAFHKPSSAGFSRYCIRNTNRARIRGRGHEWH